MFVYDMFVLLVMSGDVIVVVDVVIFVVFSVYCFRLTLTVRRVLAVFNEEFMSNLLVLCVMIKMLVRLMMFVFLYGCVFVYKLMGNFMVMLV